MRVAWLAAFAIAVSCSGRIDQSTLGGSTAGKGSSAPAGAPGAAAAENEGGGTEADEGHGGALAESGGKPSAGSSMEVNNDSGAGGDAAGAGDSGATGGNSSAGTAGTAHLGGAAGSSASAPTLIAFTPDHAFINVGKVASNTAPPLTVTLSGPAQGDTVVTLSGPAQGDTVVTMTSADTTRLSVENVIVPAGQTSALVPVTALAQAADVVVTAKLGISLKKHVRVAADSEPREVVSLTPSVTLFPINGTRQLTVSLNLPALSGGAVVQLALAPSDAGSIPATVKVEEDQIAAAFNFTDGGLFTGIIASATRGTSSASATLVRDVACPSVTTLLISEVRTRGPGGDRDDFIELYNPTDQPILFDGHYKLIRHAPNATVDTTSPGFTIPAHGHFLFAGTDSTLPADRALTGSDLPDASSLELWYNPVRFVPFLIDLQGTPNDKIVDRVCFAYDDSSKASVASTYSCTPVANPHDGTNASNQDVSIERKPGGLAGNCLYSGSSVNDFVVSKPSNPQNRFSPATPPAGL